MGFFSGIGALVAAWAGNFRAGMDFLGETCVSAGTALVRPRTFRFGDFMLAFQRASYDGIPVATGIGFLLGVILAFQSAAALRMFGVEVYVADLLAISLFRELGPIVTAIILAGRTGSAFAAEIGSMKVNEELDALTTMGLRPVRFLVLPRVAAAVLAMPVLTIFAELSGLAGGALVLGLMNVPGAVFWDHAVSSSGMFTVSVGLVKSALFGLLVAMVSCHCGMRTESTADGVGRSATRSVVGSIVAVAVADGILAVICYLWGW